MTDLNELIEKIEAAGEGSREIEGDVHRAFGKCVHEEGYKTVEVEPGEYDIVRSCKLCGASGCSLPPRYTRSIDAALKLLPMGWGFETWRAADDDDAEVTIWGPGDHDFGHKGQAKTVPLALCAAALKARAILSKQDPEYSGRVEVVEEDRGR